MNIYVIMNRNGQYLSGNMSTFTGCSDRSVKFQTEEQALDYIDQHRFFDKIQREIQPVVKELTGSWQFVPNKMKEKKK